MRAHPHLWSQAVALRETQLRKLVDDLDAFVHSSALTTAAWLAQIDALIFPQRSAGPHMLVSPHSHIAVGAVTVLSTLPADEKLR